MNFVSAGVQSVGSKPGAKEVDNNGGGRGGELYQSNPLCP
jgi:hypothetical protein